MNPTLKKPLATALKPPKPPKTKKTPVSLNEVTVTIQDTAKVNFHDTVMIDLSVVNHFEFDGEVYEIPIEETRHYEPSFLDFDKRLAQFYEFHTTTARFFDWFNFREKASVAVGYLYEKGNPNPVAFEKATPQDIAALNYKILRNTSIEGHYSEIETKLKPRAELGAFKWIGLIIIAIVAIVVVITLFTGGLGQPQQIIPQNITATPAPLPTPIIIR